MNHRLVNYLAVFALAVLTGCGTTRLTDTQRTATEQLLVSNAIDQAVSNIDFSPLAGKSVYFDPQYLDGAVDRGYLISSVRQLLLASGCILQEERAKAAYVVEVRTGGIGTDRHALLVGIPQMNVPTFVPGQPSQIPEIPLAKKTDQEGVAKIAVFAFNRATGQLVWQSGVVKAMSTSKDTWVLGAGPFQRGSIRDRTEFAGEPIFLPSFGRDDSESAEPTGGSITRQATWSESSGTTAESNQLAFVLGTAPSDTKPAAGPADRAVMAVLAGSAAPPKAVPAPSTAAAPALVLPPLAPNTGGQAETEPSKVSNTGLGTTHWPGQAETEPVQVWDSGSGFKPGG